MLGEHSRILRWARGSGSSVQVGAAPLAPSPVGRAVGPQLGELRAAGSVARMAAVLPCPCPACLSTAP